jgi:Fe-Mn family superoxide dismutase
MAFTLPPLPFDAAALEPHIDAMTMSIHHDKHHQAYVTNLNAALEKAPDLFGKSLDDIIKNLNAVPEAIRGAVRNNGGGHWNHSLFWRLMVPKSGGEPGGDLGAAIRSSFGDFAKFREQLQAAAWLILDSAGALKIESTPNQDNPLMEGKTALFGVDVWEHAYYLKYQNRRADYLTAFWNVVHWGEVQSRYEAAKKK